jgi:hypothetical protein
MSSSTSPNRPGPGIGMVAKGASRGCGRAKNEKLIPRAWIVPRTIRQSSACTNGTAEAARRSLSAATLCASKNILNAVRPPTRDGQTAETATPEADGLWSALECFLRGWVLHPRETRRDSTPTHPCEHLAAVVRFQLIVPERRAQ